MPRALKTLCTYLLNCIVKGMLIGKLLMFVQYNTFKKIFSIHECEKEKNESTEKKVHYIYLISFYK